MKIYKSHVASLLQINYKDTEFHIHCLTIIYFFCKLKEQEYWRFHNSAIYCICIKSVVAKCLGSGLAVVCSLYRILWTDIVSVYWVKKPKHQEVRREPCCTLSSQSSLLFLIPAASSILFPMDWPPFQVGNIYPNETGEPALIDAVARDEFGI